MAGKVIRSSKCCLEWVIFWNIFRNKLFYSVMGRKFIDDLGCLDGVVIKCN